jgi:hypothetical protein
MYCIVPNRALAKTRTRVWFRLSSFVWCDSYVYVNP